VGDLVVEAGPVIGHAQRQPGLVGAEVHAHWCPTGVLGRILQRFQATEVQRGLGPRVEARAGDRGIGIQSGGRRGPGQVCPQGRHEPPISQDGGEDAAREGAQGLQGVVGLRTDLLQQRARAGRRCLQHLTCQPSVDGNGDEVLLGAIVDVALEPAPFGILRGDDALARRSQFFGLPGELSEPRLELERQTNVGERGTRLCRQIRQQCQLSSAE
jgi:hypothetical protein